MKLWPALLPALLPASQAAAAEPARLPVTALAAAPALDGDAKEWGKSGWSEIALKPAVPREDRAKLGLAGEDRNAAGAVSARVKAGVHKDRIYLVVRWPDDGADLNAGGWHWNGSRYVDAKREDDKLALRLLLDGDFDRTMLSPKTYRVDVWLWSAGTSNPSGLAEDFTHQVSTKLIENAAEYEVPGTGTIYIRKIRDGGSLPWRSLRPPKEKQAEDLPSIERAGNASGSAADVTARGAWNAGFWTVELSRALDTGNADDAPLPRGAARLAQFAVWNHARDEHKSVSEPFLLDLSGLK